MADETPNIEGGADDAGKPAGEKAPRRRGRGAAAEQPVEGAGGAAEKPKSRLPRVRAKAAAADAALSEESATPAAPSRARRIRGRGGKAAEDAVTAEAGETTPPKPARAGGAGAAGARKPAAGAGAARRLVPGRGRSSRRPAPIAGQLVYAQAKYVRSSARKARIVCDHIRGKSVPEARAILAFAPRGVAKDWSKLLESAVANAEHNHELIGDELHVKEVFADVGPTLKRFRPRAMGRATPINKRTSHLSITLAPKE